MAIEVSSPFWVRSAAWAAFSGRSTGELAATSSGAATSTTRPRVGEVENINPHTIRKAMKAAIAREKTSNTAPKVSESEEEMLSTSPVGSRRDRTWPSRTDLRATSFCVPYREISQPRTAMVCCAMPPAAPITTTTASSPAQATLAHRSPPRMPTSITVPSSKGVSVAGAIHTTPTTTAAAITSDCVRSVHHKKAAGLRASGREVSASV